MPRYSDAKAAHKLLEGSVEQDKACSEAYFASRLGCIERLHPTTRNY